MTTTSCYIVPLLKQLCFKPSLLMLVLFFSVPSFAQSLEKIYSSPDASLADYNRIYLNELNVSIAKVVPPVWAEGEDRDPRKWAINDKSRAAMQDAFREAITSQVSANGGYPIVKTTDANTLEITVAILTLMPYAQRDEKVVTKGTGELTMQISLRDAGSNKLLAIFEGGEQVGEEYQERSDLSAMKDLTALFTNWGKRIRQALDGAHSKR